MPGRLPKAAWLILIVVGIVIGPLLWLFFKYQDVLTSGALASFPAAPDNPFRRKQEPTGPVAPDDDPDFLARLEAQNRRRAYEQRQAEAGNEKPRHRNHGEDDQNGLYGDTRKDQ